MSRQPTANTLLQTADPPFLAMYPWMRLIDADQVRAPAPGQFLAADSSDARLRVLHGEHARTREDNLAEWGRALDFPDYYGHNYAALTDCLRDRIFQPTRDGDDSVRYATTPLIVLVTHAAELLADAPPADLGHLLESLNSPLAQPRTPPPPDTTTLHVLLHIDPANRPTLITRLATAARSTT